VEDLAPSTGHARRGRRAVQSDREAIEDLPKQSGVAQRGYWSRVAGSPAQGAADVVRAVGIVTAGRVERPPFQRGAEELVVRFPSGAGEHSRRDCGERLRRFMPCGKPGSRCQGDPPRLHGPYWPASTAKLAAVPRSTGGCGCAAFAMSGCKASTPIARTSAIRASHLDKRAAATTRSVTLATRSWSTLPPRLHKGWWVAIGVPRVPRQSLGTRDPSGALLLVVASVQPSPWPWPSAAGASRGGDVATSADATATNKATSTRSRSLHHLYRVYSTVRRERLEPTYLVRATPT
jgi:hypothetical protein